MKNKYVVKYAVEELESDDNRFSSEGFIISKCYVLERIEKLYNDGENEVYYNVLFPVVNSNNGIDDFVKGKINSYAYHKVQTRNVYDSYESAMEEKEIKNKNWINESLKYVPANIKENKKKELINKLGRNLLLEQEILEKTKELEVNEKGKEKVKKL